MNYYSFHIGDYASHTAHLDLIEDLAYRRLLDLYYRTQAPLTTDVQKLARLIRMPDHAATVREILNEFFCQTEEGFRNARADREIAHYQTKVEQASRAGKASAERRFNGRSTKRATDVQPTNNQEPITKNHSIENASPDGSANKNGSRLAKTWELPDDWRQWAEQERPDIDVQKVGQQFKDYWIAKPGAQGRKLDWLATWRNWVRNQRENPNGRAAKEEYDDWRKNPLFRGMI